MSTDTRPQADALINFLFDQLPVRGVLLQLGSSWREVVALQRDAERRLPLLADSLAATTMMASTMKLTGMLTLQLQGGAGLGMLIAQCDAQLGFRGMCGEIESEDLSFAGLLAGGRLSMTVEARRPQDRYQGIVPVAGESLAAALAHYYRDSAQLDAHFVLLSDTQSVAGLMLQKMPESDPIEADHWHRLCMMADTLTLDEMRDGVSAHMVHKLFAEDDVRAYPERDTRFHCRCTAARAERAVRMLGELDAKALLKERGGQIDITCEFCNRHRTLDAVDVSRLFTDDVIEGASNDRVH
ncbi:MAG: Hsp33 family molecular chaperone HslO [Pseudomonadota bacterium]